MSPITTGFVLPDLIAEVERICAAGGGNPRVHPNGFIQLDLDPVEEGWHASHKRGHSGASRRLHIWNPPGIQLPHQGTVNEIHDHVFDMRSTVIKGYLVQRLYGFVFGGVRTAKIGDPSVAFLDRLPVTHELYRAVYGKSSDSRLQATGIKGALLELDWYTTGPGEVYTQPAFTLHDSEPQECVVTVMEKTYIHEGDATVVCRIDTPPDNEYDRASAMPTDDIWSAIERSLR